VTVLVIVAAVLVVPSHHPMLAMDPGALYDKCSLELPGLGEIQFRLRVRNTYSYTLKNGLTCRRAGCAFIDMPESTTALVQRYIIQLEREQRANRSRLI